MEKFEGLSHAVQQSSICPVEFLGQFFKILCDERWVPWLVFASNIDATFIKHLTPPSPYAAVGWQWMSIARTLYAFKKRITARTTVSGIINFFSSLNAHSDLESACNVDLPERYGQTAVLFCTTFVCLVCNCNCRKLCEWKFTDSG